MRLWGHVAGIATLFWYLRATNGPEECARLSMRELEYLRSHGLGRVGDDKKVWRRDSKFPLVLFTYVCRADLHESRRRRDADVPWRRVAAATRIFRGDESRPRRGYSAETSRGRDADVPWRRVAAAPFGRERFGSRPARARRYPAAWATIVAHSAFNFGRYFVYNSLVAFYVEQLGASAVTAGQHILVGQIADALGKFGFAPFVDAAIRERPGARVEMASSGPRFARFFKRTAPAFRPCKNQPKRSSSLRKQKDARRPGARTRVRKVVSGGAFVAFAGAMVGLAGCGSLVQATGWLVRRPASAKSLSDAVRFA